MIYAQLFCTVDDLIADKQAPGVDESRMFRAIQEASDWMQKTFGWFIPVTQTRYFTGDGSARLMLPIALLSITTVSNDGADLLVTDYVLKPDHGFWANGPYGKITLSDAASLRSWSTTQNGVEIDGHWGKYERIGDTGATVKDATEQTDTQTTLEVSDGGKVSPGMVLLIDDEQESVTGWGDPTDDVTALDMAGGLSASDETLVVDDASLVNVGEIIRIGFEKCRVRDRRVGDNQLSVIRGWNGTARVSHSDDDSVDVYRTVTVARGVNGTTADTHPTDTKISRYLVPDDILLLTKEIATLSVNKALSGYQGRTGSQDTGVVFYNDVFPKFDIEKIKSNYRIPRVG